MTAEYYLKEKERLSCAMGGQDRLMEAVETIAEALKRQNLDGMPETALDVMRFTLETLHFEKFNLVRYAP